jgi:hypothetical protein
MTTSGLAVDAPCLPTHEIPSPKQWLVTHKILGSASHVHHLMPQHPQHPQQVILSASQTAFGNWETLLDVALIVKEASLEKLVNTISERLVSISVEAELFLRNNPEIATNLDPGLRCLEDFLTSIGVPHSIKADFWQDSEAPDFEALEVTVKVDTADYDKILKLWKAADERIYRTLSSKAKEKIIVMFERL